MLLTLTRSFLLILFVFALMRLMGKRQIGQLQPFELVVAIMISDLGAVPMQDTSIPLISGLVPILCLFIIQMIFSQITMSSLRLRCFICGKPSTLISDGIIQEEALRKEMYSLSDLFEQTRNQGYDDITQIHTAILETNGQLSIIPKSMFHPTTAKMINYTGETDGCTRILIMDGKVLESNLKICNKSMDWLKRQISLNEPKSFEDVYLFSLAPDNSIFVQFKGTDKYIYKSGGNR